MSHIKLQRKPKTNLTA